MTLSVVAVPATADPAGRIVALYDRLERLARDSALEPGGPVDGIFAELVERCAPGNADDDGVLVDQRVISVLPRLRELCADGEYRLERTWADRIAAAANPEAVLGTFPYRDNYRALTALELHTVIGVGDGRRPRRACVLGSGPLPMTALLTARALGIPVDAVDLEPEATAVAAAVLDRLPGGELVRLHRADATEFEGVTHADVVVLAALVGLDRDDKQRVIAAVAGRMRPGAVLVVRSAHRLRTLLYPPVSPAELAAAGRGRLQLLAEVHPLNEVVNSLVLARRT